jgi:hypothetical protein
MPAHRTRSSPVPVDRPLLPKKVLARRLTKKLTHHASATCERGTGTWNVELTEGETEAYGS